MKKATHCESTNEGYPAGQPTVLSIRPQVEQTQGKMGHVLILSGALVTGYVQCVAV